MPTNPTRQDTPGAIVDPNSKGNSKSFAAQTFSGSEAPLAFNTPAGDKFTSIKLDPILFDRLPEWPAGVPAPTFEKPDNGGSGGDGGVQAYLNVVSPDGEAVTVCFWTNLDDDPMNDIEQATDNDEPDELLEAGFDEDTRDAILEWGAVYHRNIASGAVSATAQLLDDDQFSAQLIAAASATTVETADESGIELANRLANNAIVAGTGRNIDLSDKEEVQDAIADLIGNLHHLADKAGVDINWLIERGVSYHQADLDDAEAVSGQ